MDQGIGYTANLLGGDNREKGDHLAAKTPRRVAISRTLVKNPLLPFMAIQQRVLLRRYFQSEIRHSGFVLPFCNRIVCENCCGYGAVKYCGEWRGSPALGVSAILILSFYQELFSKVRQGCGLNASKSMIGSTRLSEPERNVFVFPSASPY